MKWWSLEKWNGVSNFYLLNWEGYVFLIKIFFYLVIILFEVKIFFMYILVEFEKNSDNVKW